MWRLAGDQAPDHGDRRGHPLIIDVDATLVTAHSEKEQAAPTFKRGFGFHPLWRSSTTAPTGPGSRCDPAAAGQRRLQHRRRSHHRDPGRAAAAPGYRPGPAGPEGAGPDRRRRLHPRLPRLADRAAAVVLGRVLPARATPPTLLDRIPEQVWTPAYDAHDQVRDGAWVAELTGLLDLSGWPPGMRVIVRKERPHPGAQLRLTDHDGQRVTAFATNTARGQLADLELRHRRRARCEDRIRAAKDTGLTNLPLHDFAQNQIWCAIVALAVEITAWMQLLALTEHDARRWEPKRLRLRLFTIPAALARTAGSSWLHLADEHPGPHSLADAIHRLRALAVPG